MARLTGQTVLVTGGAGFIGSHLVDALAAEGVTRVVVVDNFFLGDERNLADAKERYGPALQIHREDAGSLEAMAAICRSVTPDIVFNLATKALLHSFRDPVDAYRTNVDIAIALGDLLREGEYGRLVHVSSSEVYGSAVRVPMAEDHPLEGTTPYAAGKASADLMLASYVSAFDLDVLTVRPFNAYGPRQNSRDLSAVIPRTIQRVLAGEAPFVEGDGKQTRDFTYVADTVSAIIDLTKLDGPKGRVVNVGSGREVPIGELITRLAALLEYGGPILRRERRTADVRRHLADVSRLRSLLGPGAGVPLEEGLTKTVAWYRAEVADRVASH